MEDQARVESPWQFFLLAARTPQALREVARKLSVSLRERREDELVNVARASQMEDGRWIYRQALLCQGREEGIAMLEACASGSMQLPPASRHARSVAFLFPGLGEQFVGMALELYQEEEIFRQYVDHCLSFLHREHDLNLRELLYPDTGAVSGRYEDTPRSFRFSLQAMLGRDGQPASAQQKRLRQPEVAQPVLFSVEFALAQLLITWGIRPTALLGYSLGEYVAACLAGVFSLEDALTVIARRARLIQEAQSGAMLAVPLSEREVRDYLNEQVQLAAINAPGTCVLAGHMEAIGQVAERLRQSGIISRGVETTHAFHSTMLSSIREPLTDLVCSLSLRAPAIPSISNITGTWITAAQALNPTYWGRHLCQTVRFAEGAAQLLQSDDLILLEVGPGQSLGSLIRRNPACRREQLPLICACLPSLGSQLSDQAHLITTVGKIWMLGGAVDWTSLSLSKRRQILVLSDDM